MRTCSKVTVELKNTGSWAQETLTTVGNHIQVEKGIYEYNFFTIVHYRVKKTCYKSLKVMKVEKCITYLINVTFIILYYKLAK